jgi:phage terminase Nu1 subunit (DNA packaging protein)
MSDIEIFKTAVEISKILGVSDRTITRWAVNGVIDKRGKGEYCIVSVFNYYRSLLLEQISSLNEKIEIASNKSSSKSLQSEKMKQSIKIITTNAKIKQHELEILEGSLVNVEDAERVFAQGRESFREMCMNMVNDVSQDLANMSDPNEIQHYLEVNISQLLSGFSIAS